VSCAADDASALAVVVLVDAPFDGAVGVPVAGVPDDADVPGA